MNERGFFTATALCLLLVVAIIFKGAQELEMNHAYEVADYQTGYELQNAAESALNEAAEKIIQEPSLLPKGKSWLTSTSRQHEISVSSAKTSSRLGNISVKVYGERGQIYFLVRKYLSSGKTRDDLIANANKDGFVLISIAEVSSDRFGGKIYRRSSAYVIDEENIVHYTQ